ncbi:hypothetical protein WOLCODRAFT_134932 [Wolfiporia cocos MD-104 SS10]|uniref:Signal recognition particle subunit SRP68 n=1 Tax=Wolfiporia cocos (strain MD-104) TaxID=742152 RepID=A0A2H3ISZ3_WOLCO|nr:hypothetical protein WOLCODRAFT_134932 [Wolfiporia cocos MD-104 SS10]
MAATEGDAKVSFQALQLANEQRNAYGLRYNDYERYRKHCINRTHRLRSSLKMTHGKGREFKKLPILKPENIKDGYLQLLLFEAERAWVYSQELVSQATQVQTNPKGFTAKGHDNKPSALRRHATSRLRRAVNWSTQLLSHCQALHASGRLAAQDLLQATVYTLVLNGRLLRHRDEFEDALVQLSVARHLLDALAGKAATSRDQALATAFADEIGPEIRHCAHELRRPNAYEVDAIVAEVAPKHRDELVEGCATLLQSLGTEVAKSAQERQKLDVLMWEDEPVPVRNPELVDVLLRVQNAESRLKEAGQQEEPTSEDATAGGKKKGKIGKGTRSKRGVAAYDAILQALSDAEEVARKLVEAQQLSGQLSTTVAAGTRDIQFVHAFIVYQLLSYRIKRDSLLIATLLHQSQSTHHKETTGSSKPRRERVDARLFPAVVKLLDTIIQSLDQMRTLTIVDESPDLASAVDARLSFTKARRCRYLARCYAPQKRLAEALSLTQHANIHIREARTHLSLVADTDPISSSPAPFYPLTAADIDTLDGEVSSDVAGYKNEWFAFNGGSVSADSKTYKKPLFFDIALNYVQLDMERLQERAGKKPVATKAPQAAAAAAPVSEKKASSEKKTPSRAAVEEVERAPTPEPSASARSGLSSLLGGWWGRK